MGFMTVNNLNFEPGSEVMQCNRKNVLKDIVLETSDLFCRVFHYFSVGSKKWKQKQLKKIIKCRQRVL